MNVNCSDCLIISGGDFSPVDDINDFDLYIACDKGYEYSRKLGITPDIVMGDYDSYDGDITSDILSNHTGEDKIPRIMTFPKEKDDTDTMLAVKKALDLKISRITLCCALGGRMDHTISNIATMLYVVRHRGVSEIISENEHMIMIGADQLTKGDYRLAHGCMVKSGSLYLPRRKDHTLSLFAVTDACTGLNIKGAKYSVENVTLPSASSLGESNEWSEDTINVDFEEGILLIVISSLS